MREGGVAPVGEGNAARREQDLDRSPGSVGEEVAHGALDGEATAPLPFEDQGHPVSAQKGCEYVFAAHAHLLSKECKKRTADLEQRDTCVAPPPKGG